MHWTRMERWIIHLRGWRLTDKEVARLDEMSDEVLKP